MHNCRETRERLIEIVLDGVDCGAELDGCAECRAEFAAFNATLRMTRRVSEDVAGESYWNGYHARLRQKIVRSEEISHAAAQRRNKDVKKDLISFLRLSVAPLRRCVSTAVRVPVAVVVLTILAFAALGLFAVRAARRPAMQSTVFVNVPVEVPVVQEKVVTRVVYRDRHSPLRTPRRLVNGAATESTFALTGFKPTEEIKLTVLKGGVPNEK